MSDLVDRLLDADKAELFGDPVCRLAADRIAELESEVKRLKVQSVDYEYNAAQIITKLQAKLEAVEKFGTSHIWLDPITREVFIHVRRDVFNKALQQEKNDE